MGSHLSVRRIVTEEFKKEFRKLYGRQPLDQVVDVLKRRFDLKEIQSKVDHFITEKTEHKEVMVVRKYHRNNLRYLAKYFAETLNNQLKSAKVTIHEGMLRKDVVDDTMKTFKSNPQCKVYH